MSLNFQALCYLSAWEKNLPISGGLAWESQLRKCRLDYSWASLHRLDSFLDALRKQLKPDYDDFLRKQEQLNLLFLIAFYVGELRARVSKKPVVWLSYEDALAADPGAAKYRKGFHSELIIEQGDTQFLPLISICTRLFSAEPDRSIAHSAGMHLKTPLDLAQCHEPLAPQNLISDFSQRYQSLAQDDPHKQWISTLTQDFPGQCAGFQSLQKDAPLLLRSGRVVWAAIVQANHYLYQVSPGLIAPAEVLYDTTGRMDRFDLHHFAHELMQAREENFKDPEVQRYVSHLRAETTQIFGWKTPTSLCPYTLYASSILLNPEVDFPGYALCNTVIPILVSEQCPGTVMVAPWQLWPKEIFDEWLRFARQKHGNAISLPSQVRGYQQISVAEPTLEITQRSQALAQEKIRETKPLSQDVKLSVFMELISRFVYASFFLSLLILASLLGQANTVVSVVLVLVDAAFFWWLLRTSRQGFQNWYLNRSSLRKTTQAVTQEKKRRQAQVKNEPLLRILTLLVNIAFTLLFLYSLPLLSTSLQDSGPWLNLFAFVMDVLFFWWCTRKCKEWLSSWYLKKKKTNALRSQNINKRIVSFESRLLSCLGLILMGIGGYVLLYLSEVERVKEDISLPPILEVLYESQGKLGPASLFFFLGVLLICFDLWLSRSLSLKKG